MPLFSQVLQNTNQENLLIFKLHFRDKRIHEEIRKEYLINYKNRAVDENTL